jgi:hypothetical protein
MRTTTLLKLFVIVCVVLLSAGQAQQTNTASEPPVQTMTLPPVELTYVEQGEGDVVLFVHSIYADHRFWEYQREAGCTKLPLYRPRYALSWADYPLARRYSGIRRGKCLKIYAFHSG